MPSVASGGTAERIAARIVFKVLRAGSETAARYLSTSFEPSSLFADGRRFVEAAFFVGIASGPLAFQLCGIPFIPRLRLGRARAPVAPLNSTSVRFLRISLRRLCWDDLDDCARLSKFSPRPHTPRPLRRK